MIKFIKNKLNKKQEFSRKLAKNQKQSQIWIEKNVND